MKSIVVTFMLFCVSVYADFKINVSDKEMSEALNIIRLSDIGVGEEAYVSSNYFCIDKKNNLKFAKNVKVDSDREFSKYKIKRLPNNKIKVTFLASKYTTKKERIERFARDITGTKKAYCSKIMKMFGITFFYIVDSIENQKSMTDLWNNVYLRLDK